MSLSPSHQSGLVAAARLAALFRADGWTVHLQTVPAPMQPDLLVKKRAIRYAVELKSTGEARPDRVLPLLSQAILQVRRYAEENTVRPLAVVHVGNVSPSLRKKVEQFHRDYVPDVSIGLISASGEHHFIGPGLETLNVESPPSLNGRTKRYAAHKASDLFSDLNQWMLKVLLAPDLPDSLLTAPRENYRTVSELAQAAQVSVMSASRFVRRLKEEGFIDESGHALKVVRRQELFRRWQSAAMRSSPELRMRFLILGGTRQLHKVLSRHDDACIGLFAAAEQLKLGHVSGVPPYVYVHRVSPSPDAEWPELIPAARDEQPHLILKQASTPQSVFRGAVLMDGARVADVLQVWLDVSAHSSRGKEQADFLMQKVLSKVIKEDE